MNEIFRLSASRTSGLESGQTRPSNPQLPESCHCITFLIVSENIDELRGSDTVVRPGLAHKFINRDIGNGRSFSYNPVTLKPKE